MKCPICGADGGGEKFCRQCGAPMLPERPPACPACGADVRPAAKFCFKCGAAQNTSVTSGIDIDSRCAKCGTRMEPGMKFCRSCGNPRERPTEAATTKMSVTAGQTLLTPPPVTGAQTAAGSTGSQPLAPPPLSRPGSEPELLMSASLPAKAQSTLSAMEPPVFASAAGLSRVQPRDLGTNTDGSSRTRQKELRESEALEIALSVPPLYGAESAESSRQSTVAGLIAVGLIVGVLALGAAIWYLRGVRTIIVSSPRADHVFLDNEELPQADGRFIVPHLSRHPHTLKVQRTGYADSVQTLDFPLTASTEWITVSLTSSGTQ